MRPAAKWEALRMFRQGATVLELAQHFRRPVREIEAVLREAMGPPEPERRRLVLPGGVR